METTNEKQVKLRNCKVCGLSNEETRFQYGRHTCIKCNSKNGNIKKGGLYFKEYMRDYMKSRYTPTGNTRGRPKKMVLSSCENDEKMLLE